MRRALKKHLEFKTNHSRWTLCALTDKEGTFSKCTPMRDMLDTSLTVSCLSQMVSFPWPLNSIDSRWLLWPWCLEICFQPYCTRLSANGWCSPAWPANSLLLIRSYQWDVVLPPQALLMASHKDELRDGWYINGFFLVSVLSGSNVPFPLYWPLHCVQLFLFTVIPFPSLFLFLSLMAPCLPIFIISLFFILFSFWTPVRSLPPLWEGDWTHFGRINRLW